MNSVYLTGRLVKEADISVIPGKDTQVAKFVIAVDDNELAKGNPKKTDFFTVVCYDRVAKAVERFTSKGTKVLVIGKIKNNNYTKKDGQKVYQTLIMTRSVEFLDYKNSPYENRTAGLGTKADEPTEYEEIPEGFVSEYDVPF